MQLRPRYYLLDQWSSTVLAPGTGFVEDSFPRDWVGAGLVWGLFEHIIFKLTSCCAAQFLEGPDHNGPGSGGWGPLL